jgi:hypothetical protein
MEGAYRSSRHKLTNSLLTGPEKCFIDAARMLSWIGQLGFTPLSVIQMTTDGELSHAVIEAIATEEGVEPAELSIPLSRAIDPEALDSLFQKTTGTVSFSYHGYEVTVTSSGEVNVEASEVSES